MSNILTFQLSILFYEVVFFLKFHCQMLSMELVFVKSYIKQIGDKICYPNWNMWLARVNTNWESIASIISGYSNNRSWYNFLDILVSYLIL